MTVMYVNTWYWDAKTIEMGCQIDIQAGIKSAMYYIIIRKSVGGFNCFLFNRNIKKYVHIFQVIVETTNN